MMKMKIFIVVAAILLIAAVNVDAGTCKSEREYLICPGSNVL